MVSPEVRPNVKAVHFEGHIQRLHMSSRLYLNLVKKKYEINIYSARHVITLGSFLP